MAIRNMLPTNLLNDFKSYLEHKGFMILKPVGSYEVLRAKRNKDFVIIFRQNKNKDYLSFQDKDYMWVNDFLKQKGEV